LVIGTVSGSSVTAKTIIDGLMVRPMSMQGMPGARIGHMGTSTMRHKVSQGSGQ
jgi:hypothetical protein